MATKFELPVITFENYLEGKATEWIEQFVLEFFEVDRLIDLSSEQIEHLRDYTKGENCHRFASFGLTNLIDEWEFENE